MNLLPAVWSKGMATARAAQQGKLVGGASTVWTSGSTWFSLVKESFAGAWQRNVTVDNRQGVLAFSAVFSCVTGIAADISKLRPKLMQKQEDGTWQEQEDHPIAKLLNRPNGYQNRIKFLEQWVVSKLLHGNTYTYKRKSSGEYDGLFVLDPQRVKVLVTPDGAVFYQLNIDNLTGITEAVAAVDADRIIHDMMVSLWHPLVGVTPIFACGMSATLGNRIQENSLNFFGNASRPSGVLTAPGSIADETAKRLKEAWEENFSGTKIGRLAVLGDGLKYEAMTIPANDAQLIEQLKWTVEDVARAFHYPLYKLGGPAPAYNNIEALTQAYYTDCLQSIIESLELSLEQGLELEDDMCIELDLDGLMRMDSASRYEKYNKAIAGGWFSPNQAREAENMPPVDGGDSPMMQQQNWSLEQLAERDAPKDKSSVAPPPAGGEPADPQYSPQDLMELGDQLVMQIEEIGDERTTA